MNRPALVFEALADPTRREVFEVLKGGKQCVTDVAAQFNVSRPAISQHLRVLKDADLVQETKRGRFRLYEVKPDGLEVLRKYLDQFWGDALLSFKKGIEAKNKKEKTKEKTKEK